MKAKTALTELIEWMDEQINSLESTINLFTEAKQFDNAVSCQDKMIALLETKLQAQSLLATEREQIEAAHHDGYIQAGEDGYTSEHGPKVHNPVSSQQYYTKNYGG